MQVRIREAKRQIDYIPPTKKFRITQIFRTGSTPYNKLILVTVLFAIWLFSQMFHGNILIFCSDKWRWLLQISRIYVDTFWWWNKKTVADRNFVHGGFRRLGAAEGSKAFANVSYLINSDVSLKSMNVIYRLCVLHNTSLLFFHSLSLFVFST